jgi:hypothetical protein
VVEFESCFIAAGLCSRLHYDLPLPGLSAYLLLDLPTLRNLRPLQIAERLEIARWRLREAAKNTNPSARIEPTTGGTRPWNMTTANPGD